MIKQKLNLDRDEKPEDFMEYVYRKFSVFSYVLNEEDYHQGN
jgi:hypothetical protein